MAPLHIKALQPQPRLPLTPNHIIWALVISVMVLLIPTVVSAFVTNLTPVLARSLASPADAAAARLRSGDAAERAQAIQTLGQAAHAGSGEAVTQLATFFQRDEFLTTDGLATARAIASAGTRPAYQVLIQAFRLNQSPTRRYAAMAALEESSPTVAPVLIAALHDPDAGVRSSSAELLGFRHDLIAADALTAATYDAAPTVRAAAAWTLGGDLAVWQSLQRMQLLQVQDPNAQVRAAAQRAEGRIRGSIARALGIAPEDLLVVSAAPANGLIYAATPDGLYTIRDSSNWRFAGALPGYPTALAAGGLDGQTAYLGTFGSGPFRSLDGGQTWQPIITGLPAAERLTVTSLVINSAETQDAQQVSMALAVTLGTTELHTSPLGIFHTADGGSTWSPGATSRDARD